MGKRLLGCWSAISGNKKTPKKSVKVPKTDPNGKTRDRPLAGRSFYVFSVLLCKSL